MKVTFASPERCLFELGKREKNLLLDLLQRYPCVPSDHHRISRPGKLRDEANTQKLLDEALAEQRSENKKQVEELLSDAGRFTIEGSGWQLSLTPGEVDWLLQILNDIRVGSWVTLGEPDPMPGPVNPRTAPFIWAMELSGYFQMHLLEGLESSQVG